MRPISGAVSRMLRSLGLTPELAEAEGVRLWPDAAVRVLGRDAARTKALRVEQHTLIVAVPDAQWAGEIRLRERELLAALEAAIPNTGITRLRTVPERSPERRSGAGTRA